VAPTQLVGGGGVDEVGAMAFDSASQLLAFGTGCAVNVWDVSEPQELYR
jgi:hypothetical protein